LSEGDWVLVAAPASSVGLAAIQIARLHPALDRRGSGPVERARRWVYEELSAGKLHPVIARTFPLSDVVKAHRYMESNEQIGKIVVTV
jgi:NADPH:quinone reductase-like Zn-dependent oxidoreductase